MRIVYLTNGMASTLNSSFELSRRLVDAGHEVTYVSPADVVEAVEAQGLRCLLLTADRSFVEDAGDPVPIVSPLRWWRALVRRRRIRRRSIENDEIERVVGGLEPDLLLIDIEMHFAVIATASLDVPTLLPIVWFSIFRRPGVPPLHTRLEPARSRRGRARIRLAWWRLRLETIHGEWRDRLRRAIAGDVQRPVPYDTFSVDDLRAVARSRSFDTGRETDRSHWLRPWVYQRHPILCFNAREMDLPHDPWPTLRHVGPMVRRERSEARFDRGSETLWRAFRERPGFGRRPLVYCSLGTFWSADLDLLRRVVRVFERRREWDLVLGLGGTIAVADLGPLPDNALALDYAPQLEVLSEADCAITHGGITTINECVELGVPMVVYSTGHVDQDGCAVRVGFHGLGVVGDRARDDGEAMERRIERALTEPEIRRNVEAMREIFAGYRSRGDAERWIELIGSDGAQPT